MPPSKNCALCPLSGPALPFSMPFGQPSGHFSTGILAGPLSLVKATKVFSGNAARTRPMFSSIEATIEA